MDVELRAAYRETASKVRDICTRIGPAASPEWIRDQLETLANELEFWSRPVAHNPIRIDPVGRLTTAGNSEGI